MDDVTGFVGRIRETEDALDAIRRGSNVLVTGRAGIGKSAFLKHLAVQLRGQQDYLPVIQVPAGTTKYVLLETARQIHEQVGLGIPAQQQRLTLKMTLTCCRWSRNSRREVTPF